MANIFGLTRCSLWCSPPCCVFVSASRNSTYSSLTNLESFTVIFVCFWHAHIPNCCVNNNHIVYTRDVGEVSPRWPQAQCCSSSSAWEVPQRSVSSPFQALLGFKISPHTPSSFPKNVGPSRCWWGDLYQLGTSAERLPWHASNQTRTGCNHICEFHRIIAKTLYSSPLHPDFQVKYLLIWE